MVFDVSTLGERFCLHISSLYVLSGIPTTSSLPEKTNQIFLDFHMENLSTCLDRPCVCFPASLPCTPTPVNPDSNSVGPWYLQHTPPPSPACILSPPSPPTAAVRGECVATLNVKSGWCVIALRSGPLERQLLPLRVFPRHGFRGSVSCSFDAYAAWILIWHSARFGQNVNPGLQPVGFASIPLCTNTFANVWTRPPLV